MENINSKINNISKLLEDTLKITKSQFLNNVIKKHELFKNIIKNA